MNFNWQETRTLSSADLFGCFFNPPILLEFDNQPDYETSIMLLTWTQGDDQDNSLLVRIAAKIIMSVTDGDGQKYEMGSVENIEAFVEATSMRALKAIINGWRSLMTTERMAYAHDKKKLLKFVEHYNSTQNKNDPQKQSSTA